MTGHSSEKQMSLDPWFCQSLSSRALGLTAGLFHFFPDCVRSFGCFHRTHRCGICFPELRICNEKQNARCIANESQTMALRQCLRVVTRRFSFPFFCVRKRFRSSRDLRCLEISRRLSAISASEQVHVFQSFQITAISTKVLRNNSECSVNRRDAGSPAVVVKFCRDNHRR